MSVLLPTYPAIKGSEPKMLDWAGTLTPPLGGALQILDRLGSRHAIELSLPPLAVEPHGRLWASRLKQAKRQGALYPFHQWGFTVGPVGAPVVAVPGQAGTTLILRGFTPYYAVRDGQWFSLIVRGRRYLYSAASGVMADASGVAALTIEPPLRVSPADGDVAEFARPMIEGVLSGNEVAWTHLVTPHVDLGTITITEME